MSILSSRSRFGIILVAATAGLALPLTGCPKKPPQSDQQEAGPAPSADQGIQVNLGLDDAQKKKADELAGKVKDGRFPNDVLRDSANAKLFLHLAATSDKPEVIMASLQGMARTYSHAKTPRKTEVADENYGIVIGAHLASKDNKVMGFAIEAASHAIAGKQPAKPVVEALLKIASAHENAPARSMALDMLRRVPNFQQDKKIAEVFLKALDAEEPYVVSAALFGLRLRATGLVMRNQFLEKCRKLFSHADAGVRGRSAEVAGRLGAGKADVAAEIEALLKDENAFTRSAACAALAHMGDLGSVHKIAKLLEDKESNKYDIRGYQLPTGRAGVIHHDGSAWSQVRDAAIRSLQRLSAKTKTRFKPDRVNSKEVEEGLTKNAKAAKAWYTKIKAQLPKERPDEAPTDDAAKDDAAKDDAAKDDAAKDGAAKDDAPKKADAAKAAAPKAAPKKAPAPAPAQ